MEELVCANAFVLWKLQLPLSVDLPQNFAFTIKETLDGYPIHTI